MVTKVIFDVCVLKICASKRFPCCENNHLGLAECSVYILEVTMTET